MEEKKIITIILVCISCKSYSIHPATEGIYKLHREGLVISMCRECSRKMIATTDEDIKKLYDAGGSL